MARWWVAGWVVAAACAGGDAGDDGDTLSDETDVADTDRADTDGTAADTDDSDAVVGDTDSDEQGTWDTADTGDSDGPVDADLDGWSARADCDDGDPDAYPGAAEVCDGVDQDCGRDGDGTVATFVPTVGAREDVTLLLRGTSGAPLTYDVDRGGTLALCGGPWYARISIAFAGARVGGVPGSTAPILDATGATGAAAITVSANDVIVSNLDATRRDGRVLDVAGGVTGLSLRALSLAGGSVMGSGACLLVGPDAVVSADDLHLKDCVAGEDGGGAFVSAGASLTLTDAVVRDVEAGRGGALAVSAGATLTMTGGQLGGAADERGGALFVAGGDVELDRVRVRDGEADVAGGGVAIADGTVSLTDCALERNTTFGVGGGLAVTGGTVVVTTSTVVSGGAVTGGGAHVSGGSLTLDTVDLGTAALDNSPDDVATTEGGPMSGLGVVSLTCTVSGCD